MITIVEVTFAKQELDRHALDSAVEEKLERLWHPDGSPIRLVDVHEIIAREAARLLRDNLKRGWTKTRAADAIHLATARREFADEFLTNEHAMLKWGPVLGFKVCPPHFEPTIEVEPPLFAPNDEPKTTHPNDSNPPSV